MLNGHIKSSILFLMFFNFTLLFGQVQKGNKLPMAEAGPDLRVYAADEVLLNGSNLNYKLMRMVVKALNTQLM